MLIYSPNSMVDIQRVCERSVSAKHAEEHEEKHEEEQEEEHGEKHGEKHEEEHAEEPREEHEETLASTTAIRFISNSNEAALEIVHSSMTITIDVDMA